MFGTLPRNFSFLSGSWTSISINYKSFLKTLFLPVWFQASFWLKILFILSEDGRLPPKFGQHNNLYVLHHLVWFTTKNMSLDCFVDLKSTTRSSSFNKEGWKRCYANSKMKTDNSAYSHSNITGKKFVGTFQAYASSIQEPLSSGFTFKYMQVHAYIIHVITHLLYIYVCSNCYITEYIDKVTHA